MLRMQKRVNWDYLGVNQYPCNKFRESQWMPLGVANLAHTQPHNHRFTPTSAPRFVLDNRLPGLQ